MKPPRKKFFQNTIAIVYDFDETLSPEPMQNYSLLPGFGLRPSDFWEESALEARNKKAEPMLTYLRLLLEKAKEKRVPLTKEAFRKFAKQIKYFPGVEGWFDRINKYVNRRSQGKVKVKHYLVSAGIKEILIGLKIRSKFSNIFGSEYHFNYEGRPDFLTVLITDTTKTQYLFRINKGKEDITEPINEHMEENERPIPFTNMIYIGDGMSDVPSMTLTKKSGGYALAVHSSGKRSKKQQCLQLLKAKRVDFVVPADYRKNKLLDKTVKLILDSIISNIACQKEKFSCCRFPK